jgi:hypothetical protein
MTNAHLDAETEYFSIVQCVQGRDEALLSLNKEKIEAFMNKWNAGFPYVSEVVFWAAVHKARLEILSFPEEEKEKSRQWLLENGFNRYGGFPV